MNANYGKECAIYGTLANREHFDDLMFWNYIQSYQTLRITNLP